MRARHTIYTGPVDEYFDHRFGRLPYRCLTFRHETHDVAEFQPVGLLGWNHRVALHLFGERLAIELTDHDLMVDVGHGRPVRRAEGDPVWREDRDFIDAVQGRDNRIRCSYAEAVATLRIALAVGESARTGRSVNLVSHNA